MLIFTLFASLSISASSESAHQQHKPIRASAASAASAHQHHQQHQKHQRVSNPGGDICPCTSTQRAEVLQDVLANLKTIKVETSADVVMHKRQQRAEHFPECELLLSQPSFYVSRWSLLEMSLIFIMLTTFVEQNVEEKG